MTVAPSQRSRFRFTEPQLAAALTLGAIRPGPRSLLPDLAPVREAAALLHDTGALSGAELDPACAAALRVLADPATLLSIVAKRADEQTWAETLIAHGTGDIGFVAFPSPGVRDYTYFATATECALYADLLLGFSGGPSGDAGAALALSVPALAALLALADLRGDAAQRARREQRADPNVEVTPAQVEAQLAVSLQSDDTRWAATAVRHLAPVDLGGAKGQLGEGLSELASAGLVTSSAKGWALSAVGSERVSFLAPALVSGALTLATLHGRGRIAVACVSVLRSPTGISLLAWPGSGSAATTVSLSGVTAARALDFVGAMLESEPPPPAAQPAPSIARPRAPSPIATAPPAPIAAPAVAAATRFCDSCGASLAAGTGFCPRCGKAVGAPVAGPGAAPTRAAPAAALTPATPVRPRSSSRRWLLGGVAVIALLVIAAVLASLGKSAPTVAVSPGRPAAIVLSHLIAIEQGDYARAYTYTHPDYRREISLEFFRTSTESFPIMRTGVPSIVSEQETGDLAEVYVDLRAPDGKTAQLNYTLLRVQGTWLIRGGQFKSGP